jgi:FtsH-binding integral membrane protein
MKEKMMRDEFPDDDAEKLWQNQPTGTPTMTIRLIRSKARELQTKTRRQLLGTLAGPLATSLFYAFGNRKFPTLQHVLQPLFTLALAWGLAGLYFLNRGMWSATMPGDLGLSTGLEFCRRELERRRHLLRRILLWSFGPVLLAIGTFILALAMIGSRDRGIFPNGLPFLVLVFVWIVGYFVVRFRDQRELKREIDELNDIERENSQ